jgi:acyl carrier protein
MVKIDKLIETVKAQFMEEDDFELNIDSNFKDLKSFDSLTGMCIIVAMKDEFGKEIVEEEFRKIQTIRELFDLVSK